MRHRSDGELCPSLCDAAFQESHSLSFQRFLPLQNHRRSELGRDSSSISPNTLFVQVRGLGTLTDLSKILITFSICLRLA